MLPDGLDDNETVAAIEDWDSEAIVAGVAARGEVTLVMQPAKIRDACQFLREGHGFARLSNLTAVDRHPADPRFEVVYHLHSIVANERLRLKCCIPEASAEIDSVTGVWAGADWYEREVFDLFGISFRGHPNMKRIMMPEDWVGHPLRKDFPVDGHKYGYQDE